MPRVLADFDAVLAMYHDQGLPVIKHAGFERAVNVTLGLPILRTSVDHGTALDLAGTGKADRRQPRRRRRASRWRIARAPSLTRARLASCARASVSASTSCTTPA